MIPNIRKICFVGLDNYPVLNPAKGTECFGGESVQQTLLAKAFRELGYDVSMIVKDHNQPQGQLIDGIRVWKTFSDQEGIPVLRFVYPRLTSIVSALRNADADVYYQSCAGMLTGVVAWFCRRHQKKFIFRLAHDSDCIPGEQIINLWRDRKIYEYGLRRADIIAAQGRNQVELLHKHYGLDSVAINMAVELPVPGGVDARDIDILWVNNIRDFKRPLLLLQLAEMLPTHRFVMIGGAVSGFERLYEEVLKRANVLANVDFLGAVPYHEVNNYFSRAKLFVNTSDLEGFPNSFLQAWARDVPVVSFFDPDGLIASKGLGAVPGDLAHMAKILGNLLEDDESRSAMAKIAHDFVYENYIPVAVAKRYEVLVIESDAV